MNAIHNLQKYLKETNLLSPSSWSFHHQACSLSSFEEYRIPEHRERETHPLVAEVSVFKAVRQLRRAGSLECVPSISFGSFYPFYLALGVL